MRAIVAAVLSFGLVLAIATLAWAEPSLSIDSGPSGPTNAARPVFGFTADAGATVECSIDQGIPAYGPCSDAATHVPDAPLPDGEYVFRVRATDDQQEQAEKSRSFSVDTAPPVVSIDSGPSGLTSDATPSFGFRAEPGATVECSIDQGTPAYAPCTSPSTHTSVALLDGAYVFRVRATDAAGNEATASQTFSVDDTPPSVSIGSGPSGPTNDPTPSFGFTAEAGASVECSVDQGTPAYGSCSSVSAHTSVALSDGAYVFRVRATDAAGNQAVATRSFSVDTVAPSVSIGSGPSGPTNDPTPSFGFTAGAGASVECSVDQGTPAYGSCSSGSAHTSVALSDGAYVFRVRARDAAGNQNEASRGFVVDTVAPTVGVVSGPAGPTNDTTPSFGFTAEAGATLECSIDHGSPAYGPCTTASSHMVGAPLSDGAYVFRVRARDSAGNQASSSQAFAVDSAAPSLSIDSGPAGPTNDTVPSFGFTAEAGTTLECSIDQATTPYGPCTSATTHVVGTPLPEGTHVFRVQATDGGGNHAIVSRTFTVDTTPPALSIDFGPSGTTGDNTPLFGFSAEAGATVECSIDQGTSAFGPCATAATHAAVAPLSDGAYVFHVRATDAAGNQTSATRGFTVDTAPAPGPERPRPDPTPSAPQVLSPFPLVRISGTLTSAGARIRLLTVRAPRGTLVRVTVRPPCGGKRRSSRRCHVLQASGTVGRSALIGFRDLARAYRGGTVIVVRVWRAELIGKYTRFTIVRGKAPRRVDQCLVPGATRGSRCPSA